MGLNSAVSRCGLSWFPASSAGKESSCNAGDPGLIPGLGRSLGEGIGYPRQYSWASLVAQLVKESTHNVENLGSIPGLGRSPGGAKGYPLQYSGLEHSMDCTVHGVTKSWTRLSDFHFSSLPFPGGSDSKESACSAGDLALIPGSGRAPGEWNGNPLQYSCWDNPHEQRSLAGFNPWSCKESDMTERVSTQRNFHAGYRM